MKYYAVKSGRNRGIFTSWAECEKQVKGFNNASFKSFASLEEAKSFLNDGNNVEKSNLEDFDENSAIAYVDGSYDASIKIYGYGSIIFHKGIKHIIKGNGNDKELIELRNVAGEVIAATKTMQYALDNNIKVLNIYYDYLGIEKWFTGEWKSNTKLTKEYSMFSNSIKNSIDVRFVKVKSHSGDKYNDEVDVIARSAIYDNDVNDEIENSCENSKADLKKSKVKSGKIEPVFNIVTSGKRIDTDSMMDKFKALWKKEKRKLSDIKELEIEVNIVNNEIVFYVMLENEDLVRKFMIGDVF
ncbi:viroplasmin family protein [Clostridium paridis]|uniref:Ribonuclease H n=1 Tax=Clostridium paridis TaxID=2803863 RepID=A0A937K3C3_9CLOT|nr:ribonuclease H family protein [Clostridium paridis]MBL4932261.1 ribonuclease H family protein [Clostridium paridis]